MNQPAFDADDVVEALKADAELGPVARGGATGHNIDLPQVLVRGNRNPARLEQPALREGGATRDRLPPGRGLIFARGIVTPTSARTNE
jgi:hypothetical protein